MSASCAPSPSLAADDKDAQNGPQVEALFLVRFDKKVGYTIAWRRTTTEIALENAVEYKSLPSGLHSQASDLVYFTHAGYAGLSAFARGEAGAEERHASFVAVGILARRDGVLGRAWGVAGRLQSVAKTIADDDEGSTAPLEELWAEHTSRAHGETAAAAAGDEERLPAFHPARAMLPYLDMFGPLVFRLQQAALLRKRILFVGRPPVRAMCEFVYILSILSSLSPRDADLLLPGTEARLRLPTLFSVGVHDIAALETLTDGGWAACTTDEIIATKSSLYDVLVEMPDAHAEPKRWPRLRTSAGTLMKASQRDVARYKMVHKELFKHRSGGSAARYTDNDNDDASDSAPLASRDSIDAHGAEDEYSERHDDSMVEPMTWTRLAYSGFMWWASAGEKDMTATSEREADGELLGDLSAFSPCKLETAIIAYFHRQTSTLVSTLSDMIEEDDGEEHEDVVTLGRQQLSTLGLDTWSEADRAFVSEFGEMYMGRGVEVRGDEVDCCGLRVPLL
ncbi:hypothetical protein ACEQ8H_006638 [Pleosporales sp. CAS-2024a]